MLPFEKNETRYLSGSLEVNSPSYTQTSSYDICENHRCSAKDADLCCLYHSLLGMSHVRVQVQNEEDDTQ